MWAIVEAVVVFFPDVGYPVIFDELPNCLPIFDVASIKVGVEFQGIIFGDVIRTALIGKE